MAKRVVEKDRGWANIKKELQSLNTAYTKVGIQAGTKHKEGGSLVTIAATNEFGSEDGRVPERSFIRSTTREERGNIEAMKIKIMRRVYEGRLGWRQAMAVIGEYMEAKIKKKITDIRTPPNAPSTIARKGSDKPLIDTGHMRSQIRHVEGRGRK